VDYKTKKIEHALTEPDRKHQMQLNIYAWLVENTLLDLGVKELEGVERVRVDTLELVYVDMMKVRRFTSAGEMEAKGIKRRGAAEAEMIRLSPICLLEMKTVEGWIRGRIEDKIRAKEVLPPRLEGDEARFCTYCPMYEQCYALPE
jgi:hypothetical protein